MDFGTWVEEFHKHYSAYSAALPNGKVEEYPKPTTSAEEADVELGASCPEVIPSSPQVLKHTLILKPPASITHKSIARRIKSLLANCWRPPHRPVLRGGRVIPTFLPLKWLCGLFYPFWVLEYSSWKLDCLMPASASLITRYFILIWCCISVLSMCFIANCKHFRVQQV